MKDSNVDSNVDSKTEYRLLTKEGILLTQFDDKKFLKISPNILKNLAKEAFKDVSFYLRSNHLQKWCDIIKNPETNENEKYVAGNLIKNAIIASERILPLCQDTGTATVVAKRGELVLTGGKDEEYLTEGIKEAYSENNLRYSQVAATSMFEESNTGNNLPAQIDISFKSGNEYEFLFMAKGGGSTNKTGLFMESKAILNEDKLKAFLKLNIAKLGVAACPPYHLAVVVGGTSPESNLKMMKLASAGALNDLPDHGDGSGSPFRDKEWEEKVQKIARETGLGAQFGGKWLAIDVKVIRLPRHAGSCPISLGVSCSAHRNIKAKITSDGVFLEKLEKKPNKYLEVLESLPEIACSNIDLDQPIEEITAKLAKLKIGTLVLLSGTMIVARDIAHAKLLNMMRSVEELPEYFINHPIYYAGPAKKPNSLPTGSFGPTTAQRMDVYLQDFMSVGGSRVTLAKGNRAGNVTEACQKYGGFYLGTIGGAAALLAKENIVSSEVIAFPELGMEAIRKIKVKNLPAFIVVDDKGNYLY